MKKLLADWLPVLTAFALILAVKAFLMVPW